MHTSFALGLWAIAAYFISQLLSSFLTSRRNALRAKQLKCLPPAVQRNRYPLGIDNLMRSIVADKANRFPPDLIQRTVDNGAITFQYSILGTTNISTADPKNIQAMLATQFQDFDLGPDRAGNFWPLLGNGIFTQDGQAWEHSRAMLRPQFARDQISDLVLEEAHVQNLMKAIDVSLKSDNWTEELDLQVLFFRLTLDSAAEFLFGESVDSQLHLIPGSNLKNRFHDGPNGIDFATAFDQGQTSLALRSKFSSRYWLVRPKGFRESCTTCHEFIDHFVRLALSSQSRVVKDPVKKEKYVFLEALAAQTQDPIEIRSQLLNILLAGRDTTASLLGWLFMLLSKDPVRYKKLRDIVIGEFGTYSSPRDITFARLKSCTYLQHCNNETLRLYPVVPINGRKANKDTTLPRGGGPDGNSPIFIPAGTPVDYSIHVMQRRKDIWGEDADEFKPERWEGRKVGWEFLPFNGGPRICIGQQFALTESSYVTVRVLQRFDEMQNLEPDPVVRHKMTLTSCSGNGVKLRAHAVI